MVVKTACLVRGESKLNTGGFPPERFGANELLAELGLDRYDAWEIVKKTGAKLTGVDKFWIDFETK